MTADVELLSLPRWMETYRIPGDDFHTGPDQYLSDRMQAYARANIAPLQAENERLREALAALKAENEMLREALKDADNEMDWLDEDIDTCDHSVGVCTCSYWSMRRNMKAALSKGNSND